MGLTKTLQNGIWGLLSGILLLGNLRFSEDGVIENRDVFRRVYCLLDVKPEVTDRHKASSFDLSGALTITLF